AFARDAARNVAAGLANRFFYRLGGIRGTREPTGKNAVEHRDIIVMMASRKNFLAFDSEQATELAERRAFRIRLVTKAQVLRVALERKKRLFLARRFDERDDAIHLSLVLRDQSDRAIAIVNCLCVRFVREEREDVFQQRLGFFKELV